MTYKIGTRVKKVRGKHNIGITGVVCNGPTISGRYLRDSEIGSDMYIRVDVPWNTYGAGTVGMGRSDQWEPIIPDGSDIPSTMSIHELLDARNYEQVEQLHAPA